MAQLSRQNRQQRRLAEAMAISVGAHLSVKQTSGPLPEPEILKRYNEVHPGLAERIVKSSEDEAAHRRNLEVTMVNAQVIDIRAQRSESRIGQFCALGVAIVGMGCGTYAMTHGAQVGGGFLSGATLVSLVGAFLYRHSQAGKRPKPPEQ